MFCFHFLWKNSKYNLTPNYGNNKLQSIFLTPSPEMITPFGTINNSMTIDVPDRSGKYVSKQNDENTMRSKFKSVPGGAVQLVEEVGKVSNDINDDDIPKVEIQITEDGTIQVISDKETTV